MGTANEGGNSPVQEDSCLHHTCWDSRATGIRTDQVFDCVSEVPLPASLDLTAIDSRPYYPCVSSRAKEPSWDRAHHPIENRNLASTLASGAAALMHTSVVSLNRVLFTRCEVIDIRRHLSQIGSLGK